MNGRVADVISEDVADKVGKCLLFGSDTFMAPARTRVPGVWFHSGNLHRSRHYSRYLSLQF